MTQPLYKFVLPKHQEVFDHLVALDNVERARLVANETMKKLLGGLDKRGAQECGGCEACTGAPEPEFLTLSEFAGNYGITMGGSLHRDTSNEAMKESARRGLDVGSVREGLGRANTYHPDVLEAVMKPLISQLSH